MTAPETPHSAENVTLTYASDRLIREWRDRYAGRRTVNHQMLMDAEVLVRDAIAREREQEVRAAKSQREWALERREQKVEYAEQLHQGQTDRLQRRLAEAEQKIGDLSPRQTLMREERETVEDGTVVRLLAPTTPSYGDKSSPRPWMLGEIEDVAHRLRMGGATETTEMRFRKDAIEACVPFAEFALARTPRELAAPPARVATPAWMRGPARFALLALGLALAVALAVAR